MIDLNNLNNLENLKKRFANARVLVVGDVMLDRYWFGDVNRISPEAPVPVAKINQDKTDNRAGGAANVARNIAALGGQVAVLSIVGDDEAGEMLDNLMKNHHVTSYLQKSNEIATTLKLRVLARNQQLLRLDFEDLPKENQLNQLFNLYQELLNNHLNNINQDNYDVIILSDYGKGVLTRVSEMIQIAKSFNKKILIDPKGNDFSKYFGATLLTPNRAELKEVTGSWANESSLTQKTQKLRQELDLEGLLLTRSEEGMSLYRAEHIDHQATRAQEVYDVSGAGDTVIATMGLGLAAGYSMTESMYLANAAAGVVVAKLGTAVCTFDELHQELNQTKSN